MDKDLSIKICGINDSESAKACEDADYVGFVFYQKSERFVTAFEAKEISNFLKLPPVKLHCSMLAEDAIKLAIQDYKNKN